MIYFQGFEVLNNFSMAINSLESKNRFYLLSFSKVSRSNFENFDKYETDFFFFFI